MKVTSNSICQRCDYNKAVGQIQEHGGKILNVCIGCAWIMYDEVDGDVEIVGALV